MMLAVRLYILRKFINMCRWDVRRKKWVELNIIEALMVNFKTSVRKNLRVLEADKHKILFHLSIRQGLLLRVKQNW